MKKILLAFDASNYPEAAMEFALSLNKLGPVLIAGVFLPEGEPASSWSYGLGSAASIFSHSYVEELDRTEAVIKRFETTCRKNGIEYRVHRDLDDAARPALRKESSYADVLILESRALYPRTGSGSFTAEIEVILHDTACPVILVPPQFQFPEKIVLAFDGSEDSVFAIKQFAYQFPEFTNMETVLVYATDDAEAEIPNRHEVQELACRHFPTLNIHRLQLSNKELFSTWLSEEKRPILVSGSYGRSGLSRLFKKSFIDEIILDHSLPIFIAHR